MSKKNVLLISFLAVSITIYAEAPELRNVMPNSWRKATKLTVNEERVFARESEAAFAKMRKSLQDFDLGWGDDRKYEYYTIYKQEVGTDTFYRVLWTDSNRPNFLSPNIRFYQSLVYKNTLLIGSTYNGTIAVQRGSLGTFSCIDIISDREKAKGILITKLSIQRDLFNDDDNPTEWSRGAPRKKGQLYGGTGCTYYLMKDIEKTIGDEPIYFDLIQNSPYIDINASACLVDPNIPLRYSLQNAFDGDPSTSYVENTEDDLMRIDFSGRNLPKIEKIAVINGYAQNTTLYNANNRIKRITSTGYDIVLKDGILSYQYVTLNTDLYFRVREIYRGSRYNDTCLAGLNFLTEDGWLFGDIDEQ